MAVNSQSADKFKNEIGAKADQYGAKAEQGLKDLASKADTVKDQLTQKVQAFGEDIVPMAKASLEKFEDVAEDAKSWIKANPLKSLAIGVGLGWVAGILVMRAFKPAK